MNNRLLLHIVAPVVATSMLLLALGTGAAWYVHRSQQRISEELRTNTAGLRAGEELEILVREIRTQVADRKSLEAISSRLLPDARKWLKEAESRSLTPRKRELMGRASMGLESVIHEHALAVSTSKGALSKADLHRLDQMLKMEIQDPAHEFLDVSEEEVETAIKDNQVFADRLAWGLLLLGICGSGAGVLAGFGLARAINRRLVLLSMPIRDAAGRLDEVVGPITFAASADLEELETVLHRITERIGAVIDRLRQSERQVLKAEQLASVGQLAAGMAHELRNPLTSMKILVQATLSRGEAPGLQGRDLIVLEEEITRMERLVQSFLEFARPPSIEKKTVDIGPVVEQTLGLLAARALAAQTRIEFSLPHEPIMVNLDPGQFRQVLLNLLLNALEAGKPGGVIEVSLKNGRDDGLTVRVADRGGGLPAELGTQIFAPFVTTKETGMGLGLSICKRIAEAHGGEITAANRTDGGAEFTLRLPSAELLSAQSNRL